MILIEKIMILSVPESKGEIFDKILDVVRQSGISDVTEVKVSSDSVIRIGEYIFGESNITSHIRRLRVKIEDDPAKPKYIQTVRGIGDRMVKVDNVDR